MIPHGNGQCCTRFCITDDEHLIRSFCVSGRCFLLLQVILLADRELFCDQDAICASLKYQFLAAADKSVVFG